MHNFQSSNIIELFILNNPKGLKGKIKMSQSRVMGKLEGDIYYDVAIIPTETVMISQGPGTCKDGTKFEYVNGTETYAYSHQKYKAIDITGGDKKVYAPFSMKCIHHEPKESAYITVFSSIYKVYCADGTRNYITMALVHGGGTIPIEHESESYLKEGITIKQSNLCYKQGSNGLDKPGIMFILM